jgi:RNA polymerase sigma factor (TIGR02999 family)
MFFLDLGGFGAVDFRPRFAYFSTTIPLSPGGTVRSASSYPVTELLSRWSEGDTAARDALIPIVYDELRRVAKRCLGGQRNDHTLQPTALVHEAYLRLVKQDNLEWHDRVHFFAMAAKAMRQILVDHARRRRAVKRGGGAITMVLDEASASQKNASLDLIALDDALQRLAALDPRQSEIVELRFFGGLSVEETSQIVDISPATIKREWATARLWLHREMSAGAET